MKNKLINVQKVEFLCRNAICTKIREFARKLHILEIVNYLWHKTAVPIFIERFLLAVLAAILFSVVFLNPMGMDNIQRVTLGIAVVCLAGFFAQTLHKHNEAKNNPASTTIDGESKKTSPPTPSNAELKQQVSKFVSSLYSFNQRVGTYKKQDFQREKVEELRAAKTEKKRDEITSKYFFLESRLQSEWSDQRKAEYDREYYTTAINLRDEMLKHIPPEQLGNKRTIIYENLAGADPIREIASDLERLSSLLPN